MYDGCSTPRSARLSPERIRPPVSWNAIAAHAVALIPCGDRRQLGGRMQRWNRYRGRRMRAVARPALGVAICVLAVGGLDCGPLNNTGQVIGDVARAIRDFLAETQFPGTLFRPSQYFCGNQVKPAGPVTGQCRGLATDDGGGIVATEGTQIRGKLVVAPGP